MKFLILFKISVCFLSLLFTQQISFKGQLWSSIGTNSNIKPNYKYSLGWLPTVSLQKKLDKNIVFDMEYSIQLEREYENSSITKDNQKMYRYWLRYSSAKVEARLGMQKIIFGPAQILRTLNWFDTYSIQDPMGQTDGVEAIRIKYFFSSVYSLWIWGIKNNRDLSAGGRFEISSNNGEWGITVHKGEIDGDKFAFDYRYDGYIGFWNETSIINKNNFKDTKYSISTFGVDYTIPILSGIYLMYEYKSLNNLYKSSTLYSSNNLRTDNASMALMVSLPIGIFHKMMFVSIKGSPTNYPINNQVYQLQWDSTYDKYSINIGLYNSNFNNDFYTLVQSHSVNGVKIMFIYNY